MTDSAFVIPGTPLASVLRNTPGAGTHIQNDQIFSSILGRTTTAPVNSKLGTTSKPRSKQSPILSILRPDSSASNRPMLPAAGAQVYAKIISVQRQQALCEIRVICPALASALPSLSTGPTSGSTSLSNASSAMHALATPFRGILRAQDVRATEKDKIKLNECFRVGDIVRAVVISIGDQGGYYLSTAGNEYGVVMAWSKGAGNLCVPVSWCEVVDGVTGAKEFRKVAKPI